MFEDLKLESVAIGSLPHNNPDIAMEIVKRDFAKIPFFPQLANVNRCEDMIIQLLEGMPLFSPDKISEFKLDPESEEFYNDLEVFFTDYEEINENPKSEKLEKYAISKNFSSTFDKFLDFIKQKKPKYAKAQITGPFTVATSLTDINNKSLIFDETLSDVVVKLLCLKSMWIIQQIKKANPETTPIVFTDEPTLSQIGTSAYISVSVDSVCGMFKQISDTIHLFGGLSAMHCCGKCDWQIPIKAGYNIINPDGYSFAQHFSLYSEDIEKFLQKGGKIVWGIIPTLDSDILSKITVNDLVKIFENSVNYLTNRGINAKLVTDNSLVSSSCGAGSLSEDLAEKAMDLIKELSDILREKY